MFQRLSGHSTPNLTELGLARICDAFWSGTKSFKEIGPDMEISGRDLGFGRDGDERGLEIWMKKWVNVWKNSLIIVKAILFYMFNSLSFIILNLHFFNYPITFWIKKIYPRWKRFWLLLNTTKSNVSYHSIYFYLFNFFQNYILMNTFFNINSLNTSKTAQISDLQHTISFAKI